MKQFIYNIVTENKQSSSLILNCVAYFITWLASLGRGKIRKKKGNLDVEKCNFGVLMSSPIILINKVCLLSDTI